MTSSSPPISARLEPQVIHGVLLRMQGMGILLCGPPGIGKSQTALDLIQRHHTLIADDAPQFHINDNGQVIGRCPDVLQDFLEVRGLGVLNIRAMYGEKAVAHEQILDLIIELIPATVPLPRSLSTPLRWRKIGDCQVATLSLSVTPERPLAALVEALVCNELLRRRGYDASAEFCAKQHQRMQQEPV